MKVEYLSPLFPKSPRSWSSDEWLRSYGPMITKYAWNSKCHNFWSKTPNWSTLFAKCLSWPILSKSTIALHERSSYDHHCSHVQNGGKFHNSNLVDATNKIRLPWCLLVGFKWSWSITWYCSHVDWPCKFIIHFLRFISKLTKHD